jgi:nucleoside-diphosphate-sugar epimerase
MPSALILGGTGAVGRAVARRLLRVDWSVRVTGREKTHASVELATAGMHFFPADRNDPVALAAAAGGGVDLLVDCTCFTAEHARLLLPLARHANSTVMISSKAVYIDDAGRHSNSTDAPRFAGPVTEQQATMAPGTMDYQSRDGYGANKVAAEQVLLDSGLPVSVLRPSKIHGEGSRFPREWYFVKRALDRRPVVLLAAGGAGTDHTSAASNIAALIQVIAGQPGRRILNAADPDPQNGLALSRTIASLMDHRWREELLGDDAPPDVGRHPWHRVPPFVLDMSAADALGYRPVGDYATTVAEEVRWLVRAAKASGKTSPPAEVDNQRFAAHFDYAAEDAYLRRYTSRP